ncbi:MAG: prepilin-type N-terminal cleavage/methylation domain-containing protein [Candidatus Yanofskybacteria bacterium]|nr:prepilin-type N-terminal cleavage/methylation domain-containing protein [Candidatus Yanofskybacteria bacterium]
MKKHSYLQKGFTLVELLVGMALFAFMGGVAANFFISALSFQRETLAAEPLVDRLSFSAEYMSRALRGAQKELNSPACLSSHGINYEPLGENGIRFINAAGLCKEFFLEENQIRERTVGGQSTPLTPKEVYVEGLKFALLGASQSDTLQPRVSFSIIGKAQGTGPESQHVLYLQTTISQRRFDIQE